MAGLAAAQLSGSSEFCVRRHVLAEFAILAMTEM